MENGVTPTIIHLTMSNQMDQTANRIPHPPLNLDDLEREFIQIARQLSELDLILADYCAERRQLLRRLRVLQTQRLEIKERPTTRLTQNQNP